MAGDNCSFIVQAMINDSTSEQFFQKIYENFFITKSHNKLKTALRQL